MRPDRRSRRPSRLIPRLRRLSLVVLVLAAALGWVGSSPEPAHAQAPTPDRPLLLIGGTFVAADFDGYDGDLDGDIDVPGWEDTTTWLENDLGYDFEPGPALDDPDVSDSLFIGQMKKQDETPPGWTPQAWNQTLNGNGRDDNGDGREDIPGIRDFGGSSAGLAPMLASTLEVANQILWYSTAAGGQIDVIAHSQGGTIARSAIRLLAQPPAGQPARYPVHTLVTIGAADYGISTHAPEFQIDTGLSGLDRLWKWFVTDASLNACRDAVAGGSLPVCPDFVRKESPTDPDRPLLPPVIPDPNNPDARLHATDFMPLWVNNPAPPGRLPGASTGQTRYYHLYSQVFSSSRGVETQASERIKLFPSDPHMAQGRNWCVQEFVRLLRGVTNHPVHHIREWADPDMRLMMTVALAGATNPNLACP